MYKLSKAEMQTHITWDAEQKQATLYTCDTVTIRKLDRLVKECPNAYRCIWVGENPTARKYTFPARYLRFGKPASEATVEAGRRKMRRINSDAKTA